MKIAGNHPVADLFPMLTDGDLDELAADIAARGLLQPIVLDSHGRILDGRNRYAACQLAEVEPAFVTYDGNDPDGYALAVNIARRHLTKGQIAMVAAKAAAVSPGNTVRGVASDHEVSASRISKANVVLSYAGDLADSVVSGAVGLNEAYDTARQRKREAESDEVKLGELRDHRPDLADQVIEGTLTLAAARAAWIEDERRLAERQRDARTLLRRAVDLIAPTTMDEDWVRDWVANLGDQDPELAALAKRADLAATVLGGVTEGVRS